MRPAEFRTHRDSLGLSTAFVADRIGVSEGMVWRYESPQRSADVPEHAAAVMRELLTDRERAVHDIADDAKAEGVVAREGDLAIFEAAHPQMEGWGKAAQGLALAEVSRALVMPVEYR